jgi:hypothetical protein
MMAVGQTRFATIAMEIDFLYPVKKARVSPTKDRAVSLTEGRKGFSRSLAKE